MKNGNKRLIAVLALVLTLVMVATACKAELQQSSDLPQQTIVPNVVINQPAQEEKNLVTVNGSGKVTLEPDLATLRLGVSSTAETAVEAQNKNSSLMEAVLASVKANGIADKDIATSYVNLHEMYNYDKSPAVVVGYSMENEITVKVRALDTLGKVISDAVAAGATSTNGVAFSIEDTTEAYRNALAAALTDAAAKAQAIAEAAGATLTAIPVGVSETSYSSTPVEAPRAGNELAASDMAAVPVSPGEIAVTATVSAEYEISAPQ
ncbi:MAG: SIMPL domain-containing protein [Eubacteriales bacterium]|nr:SIMPL domain-containing protein [Eubacteriales bacterium]